MTHHFTNDQLSDIWLDYVGCKSLRETAARFSISVKFLIALLRKNHGDDYVEKAKIDCIDPMQIWLRYLQCGSLEKVAIAEKLKINTVANMLKKLVGDSYVSKARHGVYHICKDLLESKDTSINQKEIIFIWLEQKCKYISEIDANSRISLYSDMELQENQRTYKLSERDSFNRYFNY